jgi:hypothetical protein
MGPKTAIVAFVHGDASEQLRKADRLTVEAARQLIGLVHPDRPVAIAMWENGRLRRAERVAGRCDRGHRVAAGVRGTALGP